MYQNWINGLLGLLIIAVAFVDLAATTQMWTLGIIGAIIAGINFWEMMVDSGNRNVNQ